MGAIAEVFGLKVETLLIQSFNFALAALVLWYFLYRPLVTLIEKRRADTIEAVANAERAANELAEADTKKKEIISQANLAAEEIVDNARSSAREQESELVKEAHEKSSQIIAEAKTQGEELKRSAVAESKEEIAKLIVLGIEKTARPRS
ncbi:hypothetical protein GVX82_03330 [Patescibacteria group bacterium]|jgi:F-type H+-transporting ATPase subunit b|nr:hypothetical protein [Patescibacteria group bacterium]